MKVVKGIKGLVLTILASLLFLFLGVIYFMISIWIIKIGAQWAGFSNPDGGMVVLGACIVTAGTIIGSAIQQ